MKGLCCSRASFRELSAIHVLENGNPAEALHVMVVFLSHRAKL